MEIGFADLPARGQSRMATAVELEPHARHLVALDAPAVRQLAHEVEPPAGRPRRVRDGLGQLEAVAGVADLDPQRALAGHDDEPDHVVVVEPGVADRVRHQLGHEQPRVLEPPRGEVVGELAERPPGLRGGVGVAREVDLVPHARITSSGAATKSSRSRIRVISNTRITWSLPGTSASRRPRFSALWLRPRPRAARSSP